MRASTIALAAALLVGNSAAQQVPAAQLMAQCQLTHAEAGSVVEGLELLKTEDRSDKELDLMDVTRSYRPAGVTPFGSPARAFEVEEYDDGGFFMEGFVSEVPAGYDEIAAAVVRLHGASLCKPVEPVKPGERRCSFRAPRKLPRLTLAVAIQELPGGGTRIECLYSNAP